MPMEGLAPTRRLSRPALLRGSTGAALLAALVVSFPDSLPAADNITARLASDGKVIFVNEEEPVFVSPKTGKRVVASTTLGEVSKAVSGGPAQPIFEEQALTAPAHIDTLIEQAAQRHNLDPDLIRAMIRVESNFDPYAVSPKGARGLMQLIPATAMRFGVENPFDPRSNIDGGIRYMKYLLAMYQGDLQLSLAAYNAGEQAVARSGGVPAYRETRNYIRKIAELYPLRPIPGGLPPEPTIGKFVDGKGVVHFSNLDQ